MLITFLIYLCLVSQKKFNYLIQKNGKRIKESHSVVHIERDLLCFLSFVS